MKTFLKQSSEIKLSAKILYLTILILIIGNSCEKENNPKIDQENNPKIDFVFNTNEIIYYPDNRISLTFDIKPNDDLETYSINWYNPDTLIGAGPIKISLTSNLILDFEISDNKNTVKRFQYEIKIDTIDSVKYDYRNNYIGTYYCNVTYYNDGSTEYYQDTLTVVKNNSFNMLNILTKNDIINNYEGNKMTYLNPTGDFFGYHSGVSFSNDSILYSVSGPLGSYYTNTYEGIKIK